MFAILRSLRSVVVSVVNGVSRDGRVDGVGPRHGNLDSPVVERLCEVGKRDIKPHDQVKQLEKNVNYVAGCVKSHSNYIVMSWLIGHP